MMTTLAKQEEVKAFVNDLTPGQIRTALEFYLFRYSPLEELIDVSKMLFEMLKDLQLNEEERWELENLEKKFGFWATMC